MVVLKISWQIFSYVVYIISMYYLIISFFGIVRKKDNKVFKPEKNFAVIIAAHNEESVIQDIVKSLKMIDYPKNLYDVFVVADNCDDSTAVRARAKGAIVFERFNKDKKGKGYALEWMFQKIFKMRKHYDAVVIFDADNLVSKNFLKEMNRKLCEGYKVVQGYLDSKNPYDTWITGSYSISFWLSNRYFQLSRNNLGLSNQLGGTGFCVDTEILKKLGWGATCLTEDLEFTCKLILNGYKVGWAHDAVIFDEKPLTLKQSWSQRKRWMQGFADVESRYFFKLLKKSVKNLSFTAFDCALYSIQPVVLILFSFATIISGCLYSVQAFNSVSSMIMSLNAGAYSVNFDAIKILLVIFGVVEFLYTPFILLLDKKLSLKIFAYYIIYPIYSITWLPITIQGMLNKNNKEWSHTKHTRSMSIEDMEKAN